MAYLLPFPVSTYFLIYWSKLFVDLRYSSKKSGKVRLFVIALCYVLNITGAFTLDLTEFNLQNNVIK